MTDSPPHTLVDPEGYVRQMAQLLNLSLPASSEAGVVENIVQLQGIAQGVLDFPLPDDLEAGPTFTP